MEKNLDVYFEQEEVSEYVIDGLNTLESVWLSVESAIEELAGFDPVRFESILSDLKDVKSAIDDETKELEEGR